MENNQTFQFRSCAMQISSPFQNNNQNNIKIDCNNQNSHLQKRENFAISLRKQKRQFILSEKRNKIFNQRTQNINNQQFHQITEQTLEYTQQNKYEQEQKQFDFLSMRKQIHKFINNKMNFKKLNNALINFMNELKNKKLRVELIFDKWNIFEDYHKFFEALLIQDQKNMKEVKIVFLNALLLIDLITYQLQESCDQQNEITKNKYTQNLERRIRKKIIVDDEDEQFKDPKQILFDIGWQFIQIKNQQSFIALIIEIVEKCNQNSQIEPEIYNSILNQTLILIQNFCIENQQFKIELLKQTQIFDILIKQNYCDPKNLQEAILILQIYLNEEEDIALIKNNTCKKILRKGILSFFIKVSHLSIQKIQENKLSNHYQESSELLQLFDISAFCFVILKNYKHKIKFLKQLQKNSQFLEIALNNNFPEVKNSKNFLKLINELLELDTVQILQIENYELINLIFQNYYQAWSLAQNLQFSMESEHFNLLGQVIIKYIQKLNNKLFQQQVCPIFNLNINENLLLNKKYLAFLKVYIESYYAFHLKTQYVENNYYLIDSIQNSLKILIFINENLKDSEQSISIQHIIWTCLKIIQNEIERNKGVIQNQFAICILQEQLNVIIDQYSNSNKVIITGGQKGDIFHQAVILSQIIQS